MVESTSSDVELHLVHAARGASWMPSLIEMGLLNVCETLEPHSKGVKTVSLKMVVSHGMDFVRDCRAFGLQSALRGQKARFGNGTLRLSVPNIGDVTVRRGDSDYETLRQIFVFQEYRLWNDRIQAPITSRYREIHRIGGLPLIIDAGANVGFAALWFAKLYPQARIVCIEPDPQNYEVLRANISGLSNVCARHAAIGANPGFVKISNEVGLSWGSETTRSETGTVPIVTIGEIVASVPNAVPFIVKVDIEGFEEDLFSENLSWLDETCAVFIEPHDWLKPNGRTSRSFQKAFGERSFGMFLSGEHVIYVNDRYLPSPG
jgi:FkbM family methyltransferase